MLLLGVLQRCSPFQPVSFKRHKYVKQYILVEKRSWRRCDRGYQAYVVIGYAHALNSMACKTALIAIACKSVDTTCIICRKAHTTADEMESTARAMQKNRLTAFRRRAEAYTP